MAEFLTSGQWLSVNERLTSGNRAFDLVYQGDGNLVLYRWDGLPIWASNTPGQTAGSATMQGDGMFVLYTPEGVPYWSAKHHAQPGSSIVLQSDGNLVIYNVDGVPIWASDTPQTDIPEIPGPEPLPDLTPLHVQGNRRWINVDLRGITAFGLAGAVRTRGWEIGRDFIDMCARERFNCLHVITTLTGPGYWAPCEIGPQAPGSFEAMDRVVDYAASRGIYTQWILYGGLDFAGGHWDPSVRADEYSGDIRARAMDWAFQVVRRYRGRADVLYNLVNEPDQTGFKHSFGKLVEDGSQLKAETPGQLWTFGSPSSGDVGMLLTNRADLHSTHLERISFDGEQISWVTTKRSGDDPSIDQNRMPYWHDEDWNRGEGPHFHNRPGRNDFDVSPASAFCAAAHARARQHLVSYHWDGGLFADMPGPQGLACMQAFQRGLDAFPRLTGTKWRGHHAESFVRSAPFAPDDDPRVVRQHVDRGNLWRVVGVDNLAVTVCEHRDFDLKRFGAGAVVDRVVHGNYASGVYHR